jgi:hypothetical protein
MVLLFDRRDDSHYYTVLTLYNTALLLLQYNKVTPRQHQEQATPLPTKTILITTTTIQAASTSYGRPSQTIRRVPRDTAAIIRPFFCFPRQYITIRPSHMTGHALSLQTVHSFNAGSSGIHSTAPQPEHIPRPSTTHGDSHCSLPYPSSPLLQLC